MDLPASAATSHAVLISLPDFVQQAVHDVEVGSTLAPRNPLVGNLGPLPPGADTSMLPPVAEPKKAKVAMKRPAAAESPKKRLAAAALESAKKRPAAAEHDTRLPPVFECPFPGV